MSGNNSVNEIANTHTDDQARIRHGAEALIATVALLSTAFIFWVMH